MCPIVSANWNNGSAAGVWALNLNNVRANTNNNVGGRADSNPHAPRGGSGVKGDAFQRDAQASAKSVGFRLSGRVGNGLEGQAS